MTLSLQFLRNPGKTPLLMLLVAHDESSRELNLPQVPLGCQAALSDAHLLNAGIDSSQLLCLAASKLIHGALGHVEAARCSVDGQHIDRLALVRYGIALAALIAVPRWDCRAAADVWEVWDLAEGFVAVPGRWSIDEALNWGLSHCNLLRDQSVGPIRTGNVVGATSSIVVDGIVADRNGGSSCSGNAGQDAGEFHICLIEAWSLSK